MAKQQKGKDEFLRFYKLIHEVASRLVGAKAVELDVAMDDCLAAIGKHFNVSLVGLGQISSSGNIMPSLRAWGGGSVADFLNADPPGPEMVDYYSRKGSVLWNSPDDLGEIPQFQEHVRQVGILAGVFCLYRDFGSHLQGLALGKTEPMPWPENTIEQLRVVGDVLFNAHYRRLAEVEAERLQRLEQVIADVAARFVHVPPDGVDAEINKALGQVCDTADADLCIFLQSTDKDSSTLRVRHEWTADSLGGPYFSETNLADYPWLVRKLNEGTPFLLSIHGDFPPVAEAEFELFERIGIQSMVWAPFQAAHDSQGYIVVSTVNRTVEWMDGIELHLGLLGNILANATDRKETDLALAKALSEVQDFKDRLLAENETLRQEIVDSGEDDMLVGKSHVFRTAIFQASQVAPTDSTVLILGETGTGKGLIARRIHQQSGRSQRPMVTVNCAALPSALIESELFGHEKGAFTGAINRKIGRFELADGGTIFLDEVGDLPIELQPKMLRILQDQQFERLGSSTTKTVDVRVIAATNRNLDQLIEQGEFRPDLYYRLGVFPIRVPTLKERRRDIPLLVWYFISELQPRLGKTFDEVSTQAMDALIAYDWPGNIRELRNIIERAMILSTGKVLKLVNLFPGDVGLTGTSTRGQERKGETLEEVERAHIIEVLEASDWKIRGVDGAAEHLGLKRTTLQSRMKKLGIVRPTV